MSRLVGRDTAGILLARLARHAEEQAHGPHVVMMTGTSARCFGPFSSRAAAVTAAAAEETMWTEEFPSSSVRFEVLPLVPGDHVGRSAS